MTELADSARAARFRRADLIRFAPLAVALISVVVLTTMWRQATHPFLEHDDWFYLLPVDSLTDNVVYERLLAEGRWLNYAWWIGPGHLIPPIGAVLIYEIAFLVMIGRLAWRWAPGWLSVPVVLALGGSPMVAELSFWSATLGLSMVIGAVAVCSLTWCAETPQRLRAWIVLATLLTFLTYPPMTLVLFVVLVVELVDRSIRELFWVTVQFGATYVASTVVVFSLNLIAFGKFGLTVRPWRNPNELRGPGDLAENLERVYHQFVGVVEKATIPTALGGIAIVACVLLPELRSRGVRLLLAGLVAFGVQSGSTILTGVVTPYRSCAWIWVLVVVAITWIAATVEVRTWVRLTAAAAVLVTGVWGARVYRDAVDYNQDRLDAYNRIDARMTQMLAKNPGNRVVAYGSAEDWAESAFTQEVEYLTLVARYRHGITVTACKPATCAVGLRPRVLERVDQGARVIHSRFAIVIVPPSHYRLLPAFGNR